ncbi:MAG: phosphoribosylaminoimidazolesuccinocarboxamide synthase [Wenzhouxiangellaceae bacterium]
MPPNTTLIPEPPLPLVHRGKVRDLYALGEDHLLLIASDRLSAFDVILPNPVPGKGEILTQLSNFWFRRMESVVTNHLTDIPLNQVIDDPTIAAALERRAVVVRRLERLPVEAVVRGYLIGSGWRDYQHSGRVCGIPLAEGLRQAEQLPAPIFTPSTKAAVGDHDENISFEQLVERIGRQKAGQVRDISLQLYVEAAAYARERGIILADTKFEFGQDEAGNIVLIDEILTPDSSRFWPQQSYQVGISPPSYDKQFVRDYLESVSWDKTPPGPELPASVIEATRLRYIEAYEQLTGQPWPSDNEVCHAQH